MEWYQPHLKNIARNFQNLIGKRLLRDIYWNPKNFCNGKVLLGIIRQGDSKMYTSGSTANSQRMLTEIKESGAIAKTRIWEWYCQKLNISLLIRSWRFSWLHIQRIGKNYTDQLFQKNKNIGTVDIIFINKFQYLIFSFFWFTKLSQVHG